MKSCLAIFLLTVCSVAAEDPSAIGPGQTNALQLKNTALTLQVAQLMARIDGLQKELETTRAQVVQLQTNSLLSELCSAAGIKMQECSVAADGTVSKVSAPDPKAAGDSAKIAQPKQ